MRDVRTRSLQQDDTDLKAECETKLGDATQKEANAGKIAIETEKEHQALTDELHKEMKQCSDKVVLYVIKDNINLNIGNKINQIKGKL